MQEPSFLALHKKLWDLFLNLFNLTFVLPSHCENPVGFLGQMWDQKISTKITAYSASLCLLGFCRAKKTPGCLMGKQFLYRC